MGYLNGYTTLRGYDAWKTAHDPRWDEPEFEWDCDLPLDVQDFDEVLTYEEHRSLTSLLANGYYNGAFTTEDDYHQVYSVKYPSGAEHIFEDPVSYDQANDHLSKAFLVREYMMRHGNE